MRTYATDAEDRDIVPVVLAVAAIAATQAFLTLVQKLNTQIPWWIDAPSVMGFYGIFHLLYDHILWRLHLGPIAFSQIPDVSGVWAGVLTSSYNDGTKINIVFYIKQTWSKIAIRTETATSTSSITMAALNTENSSDPGLYYEYISKPGAFAKVTMHIHKGTVRLSLSSDGKTLAGEYYTCRDRQNFGTLELHFVSKEKVSCEEALKRLAPEQVSARS